MELESSASKRRLRTVAERVHLQLGGEKGCKLGNEVYVMLFYALEISKNCKKLYKDPVKSPFILELSFPISDESKETYNALRDDVLERIKKHISVIETAIKSIDRDPENVVSELEKIVEKTNAFYRFISSTKPRYSSFLTKLGISDGRHLEGLETHIKAIKTYESTLSEDFGYIKEMVEAHIKLQKQRSTSKSSTSGRKSKGRSEIENKPSEDRESGSAPSEDLASSSTQSEDGASGSAQPNNAGKYYIAFF
ncbi:hypothetical protein BASA62_009383 [Batrachochytrium salamandrivorans]|nr:hypothetical protein BASA62_009383 [Batrachochytrium salamandrivorans]